MMLRLLSWLVGLLPERWTARLGAALGWLAFSVLRVRRRVAVDNLRRSLGLPRRPAERLARRVYSHLATGALEFLQVHRLSLVRSRALLGDRILERIDRLRQGRGLLILTAHLGQWDLLACAAGLCGVPLHVVTRSVKNRCINRLWMERRRRCGVRLLPARGSARAAMRALEDDEVVALVLDQHDPEGAAVPLFGRPAATSTALARMARASGAPVLPVFLVRDERGAGFRLVVKELIDVPRTPDRWGDVLAATTRFNQTIEEVVRAYPDQWLWLHRRWKIDELPLRIGRQPTIV
jgi:KDO2-lipid IV(A) lauroyltransferase